MNNVNNSICITAVASHPKCFLASALDQTMDIMFITADVLEFYIVIKIFKHANNIQTFGLFS